MINLARPLATALDVKRRLFQPEGATLVLLKHQPAGQRGYSKVVTVTSGWYFKGRTGQPGTLHVAEGAEATLGRLQKARAFLLSGEVYALQQGESVTKPSNDSKPVWKFEVTPTGERPNL